MYTSRCEDPAKIPWPDRAGATQTNITINT